MFNLPLPGDTEQEISEILPLSGLSIQLEIQHSLYKVISYLDTLLRNLDSAFQVLPLGSWQDTLTSSKESKPFIGAWH